MDAMDLIDEFQSKVSSAPADFTTHFGTVVGVLKKACKSDGDYRLVLKVLTGHTSSKEVTTQQLFALYHFVLPTKPEGGKWQSGHGDDELSRRCNAIVNFSLAQPGQGMLPF